MHRLSPIVRACIGACPALLLAGCIPIPGSTFNACILCSNSSASAHIVPPTDTPAEAPVALPAIPGSILQAEPDTQEASPSAGRARKWGSERALAGDPRAGASD